MCEDVRALGGGLKEGGGCDDFVVGETARDALLSEPLEARTRVQSLQCKNDVVRTHWTHIK